MSETLTQLTERHLRRLAGFANAANAAALNANPKRATELKSAARAATYAVSESQRHEDAGRLSEAATVARMAATALNWDLSTT